MEITSERGREMMAYLPDYYQTSQVMQAILQSEGKEFDKLRWALDNPLAEKDPLLIGGVLQQFFVPTATWGLETWERELGLPTTPGQDIKERRSKVISRIRGFGTATIKVVREVAESYDKGKVKVIEDFSTYTITVQFVDTCGIPPNIDDLKAAVRTVVPAHIQIGYEYNYLLWNDLDNLDMTWDYLDSLNLTWEKFEVYK